MKKILLIVTIPVIAILVVITVIAADSNYFPNKTAIEITGSTDNNFNNSFLSEGHMTYCNGNLYFWYASPWNYFKQGVFEVGSDTKKVFSTHTLYANNTSYELQTNGKILLASNYCEEEPDEEIGQNDIFRKINKTIYQYDIAKNAIASYYQIKGKDSDDILCFYIINGKYYYFSNDSIYVADSSADYRKLFSDMKLIKAINHRKLMYLTGTRLVYVDIHDRLIDYDLQSQSITNFWDLHALLEHTESIGEVILSEEKIFFTLVDDIKGMVNLYQVINHVPQKVFSQYSKYPHHINAFADKIYISSKDIGLYEINTKNTKVRRLVDQNVEDIYIFDNESIFYYQSNFHSIHKIGTDGNMDSLIL